MSAVCNFNLLETAGIARRREPVKVGAPLAKGVVYDLNRLTLFINDLPQPCHFDHTASWHDGSIKWLLLDFICSLGAHETKECKIALSDSSTERALDGVDIRQLDAEGYGIDTGIAEFHIKSDPNELLTFISSKGNVALTPPTASIVLIDDNKKTIPAVLKSVSIDNFNNHIASSFIVDGCFNKTGVVNFIDFRIVFTFYSQSMLVKCDVQILNRNAAEHAGGTWDLGDPGSVHFTEMRVDLNFGSLHETRYRLDNNTPWNLIENEEKDLLIYQESSGGNNWNGNNHKNRFGSVPVEIKGYQVIRSGTLIAHGDRASPVVGVSDGVVNCTCTISKFWQNFPKAIETSGRTASLKFFPGNFPDKYELQGGEQKTHTFYLDFGDDLNGLDWVMSPVVPLFTHNTYIKANVFPFLTESAMHTRLASLIGTGLEGKNNFFAKRESLDEYGWRNFGDLYADHETAGHEGDQPLVSHYNNQYDPIYGFIMQFVSTGNPLWFELFNDLAKHVTDIDIYHTVQDKVEFNGGLFWHTDHYLDASTSTHRTFSKDHNPESYMDYTKGGGPANEHCYTSGLMYHYFMTGAQDSKQAVMGLCNWMINLHSPPQTLLGLTHKFIKKDLRIIKNALVGRNVLRYSYPLSRGTGNYINTLLDAYIITNDTAYMQLLENVIKNSIHPNDDIAMRSLHDVERAWSYTVYLQALCRYLYIKEEINQKDAMYFYTMDSFLAYADWMIDNEHYYLDKPEILEYPNHTWVAQEIRKANLFAAAGYYSNSKKEEFYEKSTEFMNYCIDELEDEETKSYTRILSLLMQNFSVYQFYTDNANVDYSAKDRRSNYGEPHYSDIRAILSNFVSCALNSIKQTSLQDEFQWLSFRSKYFAMIYNKLYTNKNDTRFCQ